MDMLRGYRRLHILIELLDMVFMGLAGSVLVFFAWMDEPLVTHKQVTASKGL